MTDLDHVVVLVTDLDDSATTLEDAGFYVTARADHPFGTSNRLVMLENAYIELMTVTDPDAVPERGFARYALDSLAAGRTGPRLLAFATDEPDVEHERLVGEGIHVPPPLRFGRLSFLPDGSSSPVEFVVVIPDFGAVEVASFLCQHLNRDTVWHPSTRQHPNGATRLTEVGVPDPGPGGWERMRFVTDVPGPPFDLGNARVTEGPSRLVVEGSSPGSAEVDGTSLEILA